MQNTKNQIYFNFSYLALKLLGKGLYSNQWTAISELVANGLDARAKNVYIFMDMTNKQKSIIEIFDDGSGMSYDDLAEKYVWIGKNKREEIFLNEEQKNKVMGRKGIGKLAALYLSRNFYLISKTSNEYGQWTLDMRNKSDSDIPRLDRVEEQIDIASADTWNKMITGTMIKLVDVDLRRIGDKTIEGLKKTFSDYYLLNSLSSKIQIAVKESPNQLIEFQQVEKTIAFKNMTAIWNNSNTAVENQLKPQIKMKSNIDFIANKLRDTTVIERQKFKVRGKDFFKDEKGRRVEKDYELKGWIGIHCSIEQSEAQKNDDAFIRNKAYAPNKLRLYVRNKLAVENFLDVLMNTQAMSNYIEGEVSFDILDDDDLGDIATSNRQGFSEEDERIALLKKLLNPIVTNLIALRIKLGNDVRNEETAFHAEEKAKKEAERKAEEEARKKAEEEHRAAEEARKRAEAAQAAAEEEADRRKKQNYFLQSQLTDDIKVKAYNTHIIKNNSERIEDNIEHLLAEYPHLKKSKEMRSIALANGKILAAVRYYSRVNYDLMQKKITGDLGKFVQEYCENVLPKQYTKINFSTENSSESNLVFPPQDITVMLENIASNSNKVNSQHLNIKIFNDNKKLIMQFTDDGNGINENAKIDELFDFGYSFMGGTGIGLYQIKDVIERKLKGNVKIYNNKYKGITLEIQIENAGKI